MSKRIDNMEFSYMHKYAKIIENLENNGIDIINVSSAQPLMNTDITYYDGLKNINQGINMYGDFKGMEELRAEYAKYYNAKIQENKYTKSNIQISLGASDAIINTLISICDEEETIAIIEPFFCDYRNYCQLANINAFYITIEDIINDIALPEKTKAILFSNPNNPSGKIFNTREIEQIIQFSKKHNIYIISDEVYNELAYDKYISFSNYNYSKIIVIDSISKKFNNCGSRIGAIVTLDKEILKNISKIYDSRISISNSEQIAVINMFKNKEKIFNENLKHYEEKIKKIEEILNKQDIIEYEKPQGGVFFILTLPIRNSEDFAEWLLKHYRKDNKTIQILPANNFYVTKKNKVRLSITNNIENILEALDMLLDGIKTYKKEGFL